MLVTRWALRGGARDGLRDLPLNAGDLLNNSLGRSFCRWRACSRRSRRWLIRRLDLHRELWLGVTKACGIDDDVVVLD